MGKEQWSSGLCDCCSVCDICLCGYLFPVCLFASTTGKLDGGGCCGPCCLFYVTSMIPGLVCWYTASKRRLLREKYDLPEEPCGDCCLHFWCMPLAFCQEARELRARQNAGSSSSSSSESGDDEEKKAKKKHKKKKNKGKH